MGKNRLEAFSDGVIALIITIMVLEMKVPHGDTRILQQTIIAAQGPESPLKAAIGSDWKGKLSPILYILGVVSSFLWSWIPQAIYMVVALLWLVPDRRIERSLHHNGA